MTPVAIIYTLWLKAQYHGKPKGWGENTDFPAFEMAILGVSIGDSGRERLVSLSSFSSTVAAVW